jgi:hypothetical protein
VIGLTCHAQGTSYGNGKPQIFTEQDRFISALAPQSGWIEMPPIGSIGLTL